jgi:hypothetical protein
VEGNRFLGPHPSRAKVNTLIPLGMVLHTAVAVALPRPARNLWQMTFIYLEADAVHGNHAAGISLTLPWN